jgi:hypothetical protein
MTEQEKALYSVIFRLNGDCRDTVNACIEELLDNSTEKTAKQPAKSALNATIPVQNRRKK